MTVEWIYLSVSFLIMHLRTTNTLSVLLIDEINQTVVSNISFLIHDKLHCNLTIYVELVDVNMTVNNRSKGSSSIRRELSR